MGAAPACPPPRASPGVPRAGCAASEAGLPVRGVQVAWRRRRLPARSSVCKRFRGKAGARCGVGLPPAAGPCGRPGPPLSRARGPGLRCAPGRCPRRGFPAPPSRLLPLRGPGPVPLGLRRRPLSVGHRGCGSGCRGHGARGPALLGVPAAGSQRRADTRGRPRATAPRPARLHPGCSWGDAPGAGVLVPAPPPTCWSQPPPGMGVSVSARPPGARCRLRCAPAAPAGRGVPVLRL